MKYTPPAGGAADDSYDDGDRSAGIEGSVVPAAAFEHPQRELVHLIEHSGQTPDAADLQQVRKAIDTLIAAATGGGDTAQFVTFAQARARLPIFPEIVSADGRINVTSPAAGTVRVPSGVQFMHRGIYPVTTAETDFATVASKTYHLRWHPTDGLALKDLADAGYNPSVLAEGNTGFDTSYDDMLIARVVTNSSNVATITNLANRDRLSSNHVKDTFEQQGGGTWSGLPGLSASINWARTPCHIGVPTLSVEISNTTESVVAQTVTATRYDLYAFLQGYADNVAQPYVSGKITVHLSA